MISMGGKEGHLAKITIPPQGKDYSYSFHFGSDAVSPADNFADAGGYFRARDALLLVTLNFSETTTSLLLPTFFDFGRVVSLR
jgi:hypothetical protein